MVHEVRVLSATVWKNHTFYVSFGNCIRDDDAHKTFLVYTKFIRGSSLPYCCLSSASVLLFDMLVVPFRVQFSSELFANDGLSSEQPRLISCAMKQRTKQTGDESHNLSISKKPHKRRPYFFILNSLKNHSRYQWGSRTGYGLSFSIVLSNAILVGKKCPKIEFQS